jgi:hypothetical protein
MILHTQSGRRQSKIFEFQTKRVELVQFFYFGVYQLPRFTLLYTVQYTIMVIAHHEEIKMH